MSLKERMKSIPTFVLAAIIGPILALTLIFIAILLAPSFIWADNALSDLGNYTLVQLGPNPMIRAIIFNSGLITVGALMMYFSIQFIKSTTDTFTKIGMIPYFISLTFLIAIGIFSENFGEIHFWASVGFFASFPFAMWIVGIVWLRISHLRWFSIISILLPIVSVYIWYITFAALAPWTGMAIPEIITAVTAIGWTWIIILLHLKGQLDSIMK